MGNRKVFLHLSLVIADFYRRKPSSMKCRHKFGDVVVFCSKDKGMSGYGGCKG